MSWAEDQAWEGAWWGDCLNTFGEETKQITYAHRMGLVVVPDEGHWPAYDLEGRSVLDIGGGPVSILLKCRNVRIPTVADPLSVPDWVKARYEKAGINLLQIAGEDLFEDRGFYPEPFDEAWIYNVLQHVVDPAAVVDAARQFAKTIRIFEWINMPPHIGHPHMLLASDLDQWLGGRGTVEMMHENGADGMAYYGVFEVPG